jgi:hypothetical protein
LHSNGLYFKDKLVDKALPPLDEAYHLIFDPVETKLKNCPPEQNDWLAEPIGAPGRTEHPEKSTGHCTIGIWSNRSVTTYISVTRRCKCSLTNGWTLTNGYISSNNRNRLKLSNILYCYYCWAFHLIA